MELQPLKVAPEIPKTNIRSIDTAVLKLPNYNSGQRVGTQSIDIDIATFLHSKTLNFRWILARLSKTEAQSVSSWTGFNIKIHDHINVVQDNIGYLPAINAPATKMSTVNEVLNQRLHIMESLQLSKIVCVFDQALYAKAIEWKHSDKLKNVILRMGIFHTINCNLLSIIGKRFQDAGLRDLSVESSVIVKVPYQE